MTRRAMTIALSAGLVGMAAGSAHAVTYSLNWLNMAPTPFGSSVPNNSVFNLPGVGPVTVTYNIPSSFSDVRFTNPSYQNESVTNGPDTYSWGAHEGFGVTNLGNVTGAWDITYTFSGVLAPGTIYLGVSGLGATTNPGGGYSVATVFQNGNYLGDVNSSGTYGPTNYTPGAGVFSMQNSLIAAGGIDPHWNSQLGLVQIMDPISSLTVHFSQLGGDGVGVNIAAVVPAPTSGACFVLAGLAATRRRRM